MARKPQTAKHSKKTIKSVTSDKSETVAINQAAQVEASNRLRLSPRRFTPRSFRSPFKRRKAEKVIARTKVAGSFTIFGRGLMTLRSHWEIFGGIFLIYAFINTLLALTGLLGVDLAQTKADLGLTNGGQGGSQVGTGLALVESLISSGAGTATGTGGAYQSFLFIITSLAMIWALRQVSAGSVIRVRDALYNSSYPLVQVLFVLLMLTLNLLPAALGAFLLDSLLVSGIIIVGWQKVLLGTVIFLLISWTVYKIIASIIAIYIVTLPDMAPIKAIRSAKEIVRYRRGSVLLKLIFLPFVLFTISAIILVPLSLFIPAAATVIFFLLGMLALPVSHAYLYTLYRELIK